MARSVWISVVALAALVSTAAAERTQSARRPVFSVVEATIPEMQKAMREHRVTARELVTQYLTRIALYEKRVNAAISINPRALDEADALDADRARGRIRG